MICSNIAKKRIKISYFNYNQSTFLIEAPIEVVLQCNPVGGAGSTAKIALIRFPTQAY